MTDHPVSENRKAPLAARCPRCCGFLLPGRDAFGAYAACINCGCQLQDAPPAEYVAPADEGRRLPSRSAVDLDAWKAHPRYDYAKRYAAEQRQQREPWRRRRDPST
jgi:hypothetical protein